ncbi:MAG: AAA family ATPase [Lachnospiraceae bacterium]|jgi:nitric oxide reductase NorQ protein
MDILEFLRHQDIPDSMIRDIQDYRKYYKVADEVKDRIAVPEYNYYGREVWEEAISALLAGENLLLNGPKATGKNVLAQGLAAAFGRPSWDISFYINVDADALIGTDTFRGGQVELRRGLVTLCAQYGGFGVLDEINMARNEALAVLHAVLDFRRVIDIPGYGRIRVNEATRFIGTMNYGYAGTRELNEALASRFMVLQMPVISEENLRRLIRDKYPDIRPEYADEFAKLFSEIRGKCDSGEITGKALDLRGLLAALGMIRRGLPAGKALEMGIVNKCFDRYERQLVADIAAVRIPAQLTADKVFAS